MLFLLTPNLLPFPFEYLRFERVVQKEMYLWEKRKTRLPYGHHCVGKKPVMSQSGMPDSRCSSYSWLV